MDGYTALRDRSAQAVVASVNTNAWASTWPPDSVVPTLAKAVFAYIDANSTNASDCAKGARSTCSA